MRAKIRAVLAALLAAIALAGCQDTPDPAYCGVSRTGYEHALTEVSQRLSDYQGCVSKAIGSDDCSAQFSALSSAQSNLERGSDDIRKYCPKSP
jgi:outer membrane murein-binding lipoprotein Lpp